MEQFTKARKKKEFYWNLCWTGIMMVVAIGAEVAVWVYKPENLLVMMLFTPFVVIGVSLAIVKPIDDHLQRTFLKGYWIEDHGEVIKLFGSVRLLDMNYAYRDVLGLKPGFKIVDNAYQKYGCTVAAVKATEGELKAKVELESMGISVPTIGPLAKA